MRQLGNYYSPYRRRGPNSILLVLGWVGCFAFIVFLLWYVNTRHPESTKAYKESLVRGGPAQHVPNEVES